MLTLLRSSRPVAALAVLVLLTATLGPIAPPCMVETEAPCEEQMDHSTMQKQAGMSMAHGAHEMPEAPAPKPSPASSSTVGMFCCGLTATAVSSVEVSVALVALAIVALPGALRPAQAPAYALATGDSPPGRTTPLYITHGRFLI